jgi:predicted PurR-regulated permease PerM
MNSTDSGRDSAFVSRATEVTIRIGLLVLLGAWCFQIVRPFLVPTVWGVIIAVASSSGYAHLVTLAGGRRVPAAVVFSLLALVVLIVPAALLSGTLADGAHALAAGLGEGTIRIPPPPPSVADWPLIGGWVAGFWTEASQNLAAAFKTIAPQLKGVGSWLLATAAGAGLELLKFIFAIAIAGVLLAHGEACQRAAYAIARRLAGDRGIEFAVLAEATVRSVTRGILGVAFVQSLLAGLGFLVVGVPAAGLWAVVALLLSVIQIGIFPVVIPVLIYVFLTADTVTAVLFLVWSIFVGALDNILKPMVLGRGVAVPMAVIFIGAIGGFLGSGIIGLFVGSVVLVLGYKLFLAWLHEPELPLPTVASGEQATTSSDEASMSLKIR